MTQISVWHVNIVLFKVKVWANFHVFKSTRSFQDQFYVNGRFKLVRLAVYIMKIGPMKAILEQIKIRKVSTETQVSQL